MRENFRLMSCRVMLFRVSLCDGVYSQNSQSCYLLKKVSFYVKEIIWKEFTEYFISANSHSNISLITIWVGTETCRNPNKRFLL